MKKDLITINIDVGGTFTDGFFVWGDELASAKVPTTGHDLTVGFMECIESGAEKMEMGLSEFLSKASMVRFSTTMGTNAIIEKKGMQIGLLVTSGQEEGLYSVEGEFKVSDYFVNPELIEGVEEEIDIEGKVISANTGTAPALITIFTTSKIVKGDIIICLLFSLIIDFTAK